MISCDQYDHPLVRDCYLWQNDSDTDKCNICKINIQRGIFKTNKHHCRYCGKIVCDSCSTNQHNEHRICDICVEQKEKLERSAVKLTPTPDGFYSSVSDPIMINNNTFMFITCDISKYGIYYYDVSTDKWIQSDLQNQNIRHDNVAYNSNKNMLYSVINKDLIKYNIKNNSFEILDVLDSDLAEGAKCIFINNEFHVIGSGLSFGCEHFIYNEQTEKLIYAQQYVPFFTAYSNRLKYHKLIYLEKKNILFLFGGIEKRGSNLAECSYSIYKCSYSCYDNIWKWEELPIKMPYRLYEFGIVSCKNDRYILIVGGIKAEINPSGYLYESTHSNIYRFDVETYVFMKSNVKSPISGPCKAFITNNDMDIMDVLLSGYVREIDQLNYLPQDIHDLICKYTGTETEWVHVVAHNQRPRRTHWKIDLKYLFQQLFFK